MFWHPVSETSQPPALCVWKTSLHPPLPTEEWLQVEWLPLQAVTTADKIIHCLFRGSDWSSPWERLWMDPAGPRKFDRTMPGCFWQAWTTYTSLKFTILGLSKCINIWWVNTASLPTGCLYGFLILPYSWQIINLWMLLPLPRKFFLVYSSISTPFQ
jgi:hypothetical protein